MPVRVSRHPIELRLPLRPASSKGYFVGQVNNVRTRSRFDLQLGATLIAVLVSATGCAARSGWSGRTDAWAKGTASPDPLAATPPVVEPGVATGPSPADSTAADSPTAQTTPGQPPRAGSNRLADAPPAVGTSARSERETLVAALAELQALGAISPQDQTQLLEDLRATDPQLWPQLIQYAKVARARQQLSAGAASAMVADAQPAPAGAAGPLNPAAEPAATTAAAASTAAPSNSASAMAAATGSPSSEGSPGAPSAAGPMPAASAAAMAPNPAAVPGAPAGTPPGVLPSTALATVTAVPGVPSAVAAAVATLPQGASSGSVIPAAHVGPLPGAGVAGDLSAWQAQLNEAIRAHEAAQRPGAAPPNEADLIRLRMLYLAAGRREEALRTLDTLPAAQQAFWSNTLFALSTYLDEQSTPDLGRRATQALTHWHTAEAQLASLGTLGVKNLAFCTEVKSFGITQPFERFEFSPGQEVLLYAELENFHSEETAEGFHTAFRSSYEIFDAQGRTVDKHEFALTEETCRNRRRDFFIRYYLQMPREQLYDGKHTLRLTIEDTLGHKVGQASLDFTVKKSGG